MKQNETTSRWLVRCVTRPWMTPMNLWFLATAAWGLLGVSVLAQSAHVDSEPAQIPSSVCLSCHGGSDPDAKQAHAGHIVGIEYQPQRSRTLRQVTAPSGFGSTVANDLLVDGRVECTSCHATHEQATSTPYRLRLPDPDAQPVVPGIRVVSTSLCVNCHDMARL